MNPNVTGIKPNTLDAARITALLGKTRNRGGHPEYMQDFLASGEVARVVNEHPTYKAKDAKQLEGAIKQGLTSAYNRIKLSSNGNPVPSVKLVFDADEGNLYVINTTLHNLANEAAASN